ncbi:MAG: DUF975 family protein [Coprobacillus sp.]
MNIAQIKKRADDLLKDCKPQVIRTLIIMVLIGAIPSLIQGNNFLFSFISFVLAILFIPFTHGQIVTALKVVRNNKNALEDDDALVGFHRFKELFFTYFLTGLFVFLVAFIIIFIALFIFIMMFGPMITNFATSIGVIDYTNILSYVDLISYFGAYGSAMVLAFMFVVLVIVVIMVILSLYFFAVPYLLEQYNFKGMQAINESFSFIKGNVWNLLKLQLSFIGWIILIEIIQTALIKVLAFIPILGSVIAVIVASILAIYVYMPKYIVSMAIFFEEIAYYKYNSRQQGEVINE